VIKAAVGLENFRWKPKGLTIFLAVQVKIYY